MPSKSTAIWKFPMPWCDAKITMPIGAEVLSAGHQESGIVLWARVDPAADGVPRRFRAFNTGEEIDSESIWFIQTVTSDNGIVWHVYEVEL